MTIESTPRASLSVSHSPEAVSPRPPHSPATNGLRIVRTPCLVRPLRGDLSLVSELIRHLAAEMPEIEFHLRPPACAVDVVWITGARGHNADDVSRLRGGFPDSTIVVTGRGLCGTDAERLTAAGADRVLGWPVPVPLLRAALGGAPRGA